MYDTETFHNKLKSTMHNLFHFHTCLHKRVLKVCSTVKHHNTFVFPHLRTVTWLSTDSHIHLQVPPHLILQCCLYNYTHTHTVLQIAQNNRQSHKQPSFVALTLRNSSFAHKMSHFHSGCWGFKSSGMCWCVVGM